VHKKRLNAEKKLGIYTKRLLFDAKLESTNLERLQISLSNIFNAAFCLYCTTKESFKQNKFETNTPKHNWPGFTILARCENQGMLEHIFVLFVQHGRHRLKK